MDNPGFLRRLNAVVRPGRISFEDYETPGPASVLRYPCLLISRCREYAAYTHWGPAAGPDR